MNRVIFVEDFSPNFNYSEHTVVALNILAHYDLLKNEIPHYSISDLVEYGSFLNYVEDYNEIRNDFFNWCDKGFKSIKIGDDLDFAPFHIMPYQFARLVDSLFSQSLIILEILRKLHPNDVLLLSSYRPTNKGINYINKDKLKTIYCNYLYYEIIKEFSKHFDYTFNIQIVNTNRIGNRIKEIKGWTKEKLKDTRTVSRYLQSNRAYSDSWTLNKNSIDATFYYLKGKKVLFINQDWGLEKLIRYVLMHNNSTFILERDYLHAYKYAGLSRTSRLRCKNHWKSPGLYFNYQESAGILDNFIQNVLGVSLNKLIQKRLYYINHAIVPSLFNKSIAVDSVLKTLKVDYIIGNMKYDDWRDVMAYIGTYKTDYEFIFFSHGYDMYDADKILIELPCNIFYAVNEEYAEHLMAQVNRQNYHIKPKDILIGSCIYE